MSKVDIRFFSYLGEFHSLVIVESREAIALTPSIGIHHRDHFLLQTKLLNVAAHAHRGLLGKRFGAWHEEGLLPALHLPHFAVLCDVGQSGFHPADEAHKILTHHLHHFINRLTGLMLWQTSKAT